MTNIITLANLTFRGAIRERTYYVLLFVAIFLFFITPYLAAIVPRQGIQAALDFVMSIVSFVGLILAVFLGSNIITRDVDKKTIYSVITKPISRTQYILGRFLGMALVLLTSALLLTACGLLSFYITIKYFNYLGDQPSWFLFGMNLLFNIEMLVLLVAASFLISSLSTTSFLPLAVTIAFYYAGQSVAKVMELIEHWKAAQMTPAFKALVTTAYYLFPNLTLFDFKARAAYNLPVSVGELVLVFAYGALYTSILLLITIRIFNKRDLT